MCKPQVQPQVLVGSTRQAGGSASLRELYKSYVEFCISSLAVIFPVGFFFQTAFAHVLHNPPVLTITYQCFDLQFILLVVSCVSLNLVS